MQLLTIDSLLGDKEHAEHADYEAIRCPSRVSLFRARKFMAARAASMDCLATFRKNSHRKVAGAPVSADGTGSGARVVRNPSSNNTGGPFIPATGPDIGRFNCEHRDESIREPAVEKIAKRPVEQTARSLGNDEFQKAREDFSRFNHQTIGMMLSSSHEEAGSGTCTAVRIKSLGENPAGTLPIRKPLLVSVPV